MQITQTKQEALLREFTVTMTAQEIDEKINERLMELGKTVKMPGFRPGKIPLPLLKSKYGKSVIGFVLAVMYALLVVAERLDRFLGITGRAILTRLLGVLLAALSVQFVVDGIKSAFA